MKHASNERIKEYDRVAKHYDQRLGLYARQSLEEALRLANLRGTEAILDACCGTGELLQMIALSQHRGTMIGTDFSETMVNVAAHKLHQYENVTLKKGEITKLELPSDYFHTIFHTNAFRYLDNPQETIREFHRLLRPHGQLIFVDLAANSHLTRLWGKLRQVIRPTYQHLYRLEEAVNLIQAHKLTVVRKKLWRINLLWSMMLIEAQKPAPHHEP